MTRLRRRHGRQSTSVVETAAPNRGGGGRNRDDQGLLWKSQTGDDPRQPRAEHTPQVESAVVLERGDHVLKDRPIVIGGGHREVQARTVDDTWLLTAEYPPALGADRGTRRVAGRAPGAQEEVQSGDQNRMHTLMMGSSLPRTTSFPQPKCRARHCFFRISRGNSHGRGPRPGGSSGFPRSDRWRRCQHGPRCRRRPGAEGP